MPDHAPSAALPAAREAPLAAPAPATQGARGADRRPRLVLRVGYTGHRPERLRKALGTAGRDPAVQQQRLADALHDLLAHLAKQAIAIRDRHAAFFAVDKPLLRIVGGAAMGVDQMVGDVVDQRLKTGQQEVDWQLDLILPTEAPRFVADAMPDFGVEMAASPPAGPRDADRHWQAVFDRADTVVSLPQFWRRPDHEAAPPLQPPAPAPTPPPAPPPAPPVGQPPDQAPPVKGYVLDHTPAANFLLRQIDVLVAVWDNDKAQGPGGTADIAALGVEQGMTVVILDPRVAVPRPHLLTRVMRDTKPDYVRGWFATPLSAEHRNADARAGELGHRLNHLLAPPAEAVDPLPKGERSEHRKLVDFLREPGSDRAGWQVHAAFAAAFRGAWPEMRAAFRGRLRPPLSAQPNWACAAARAFVEALGPATGQAAPLLDILLPRHHVVDGLAERCGDNYRSLFVTTHGLAALAVMLALLGVALGPLLPAAVKTILLAAEIALMVTILLLLRIGWRDDLHTRFIEYRALANTLRARLPLAPFAEYAPASPDGGARADWRSWYIAATERELGLPHIHLGQSYQSNLLHLLKEKDLEPRIEECRKLRDRNRKADHHMHKAGTLLFVLTLGMLAVSFIALVGTQIFGSDAAQGGVKAALPFVGLAVAAAATLGATLIAIRSALDFDGEAARSASMIDGLRSQARSVDAAVAAENFDLTRATLLAAARLQVQDVETFTALFGRKRPSLPS